jgi:hypothetical protein
MGLGRTIWVEVRHLNQQVKRNSKRFPAEFLFQLSNKDMKILRLQLVISDNGRGGRRYLPYAFTEYGAIMAATVLNSERAIATSIFVVRAFVRMRQALVANQQIAAELTELEDRMESHDADIRTVVDAIRDLMAPRARNTRRIGFQAPSGRAHGNASLHLARRPAVARVPTVTN